MTAPPPPRIVVVEAIEAAALPVRHNPEDAVSKPKGKQIVILDRGFVYVGDVAFDGDWIVISNAANVRRWGTKRGLGELATNGPTSNTQLDLTPTIRAPLRALIAAIECEPAKWK